jgi:hypothetical protein
VYHTHVPADESVGWGAGAVYKVQDAEAGMGKTYLTYNRFKGLS